MRGPVGSRIVAAQMSQHVPMSLRARTTADIIIVYSRAPLGCGQCCPLPHCTDSGCNSSWVKVGFSVLSVHGSCVLREMSHLPDSTPVPTTLCRGYCCVRCALPNDDNTLPPQTTGPAAARESSERYAMRRIRCERRAPPQFGFGADGDYRWSRMRDEDS